VGFVVFSIAILAVLSGMITLLVSQIFAQLTPALEHDLAWKVTSGASALAHEADFAIIMRSAAEVQLASRKYEADTDVSAIVVEEGDGHVLYRYGDKTRDPSEFFHAGGPGTVRDLGTTLVAYNDATIEGALVGRVGLAVSKRRLEAGVALRRNILLAAGVGCLLALVLSLAFVSLYVGPLLRITNDAFQKLERTTEAALEAARLKSEFLANMSHEIRTPMNGVLAMTELLLRTKLDARQTRFADTVRASARTLLTVINDILDFSKLEAGKYELSPSEFDVRVTLQELTELLAPRAQAKGIELTCRIAHDVPARLFADVDRLKQVLTNILGNAVKFTDQGEVAMHISVGQREGHDAQLICAVRDTGPGISPEDQAKLFQSFSQVDGSSTRKFGGTGLGLVIARSFVRLMGGDITLVSCVGEGSTFSCTLQVKVVEEVKREEFRGPRGRRVLIVDDAASTRNVLEEQLVYWGMRCNTVENAEQALLCIEQALFEGAPYDLALIDAALPDEQGLTLARAVVQSPAAMPIVLLTPGPGSIPELDDAVGRLPTLPKPLRTSDLYDRLMDAFQAPGGGSKGEAEGGTPSAKRTRLHGHVLAVDDNEINQAVAEELLRELGLRVDIASNGLEALEAVKRFKYDAVLMDCQMPVMDGYSAARAIRTWEAEGKHPHTPIIALTAHALAGEREKVLLAGMDDYLTKPIPVRTLEVTLEHFLGADAPADASASLDSVRLPEAVVANDTAKPIAPASIGDERLPAEALLDPEISRSAKIIALFLRLVPRQIASLQEAIALGDVEEVRLRSHKLKGGCASVGAVAMATLCEAIQHDAEQGNIAEAKARTERVQALYAQTAPLLESAPTRAAQG
jgi:signal transduction histidine kinase/DNA-binding response OmpR family regulator/HPt (histidine-containing phosphotransfer) domain-containing protein